MTETEHPQWITEHPIKDVRPAPSILRPEINTKHAYLLTLTTGEEVVGCAWCPRVGSSVRAIATGHLSAAHPEHTVRGGANGGPGRRPGARTVPGHILDLTVADLLARAGGPTDSDWKRRALKAEKERDALRKALRPLLAEDEDGES